MSYQVDPEPLTRRGSRSVLVAAAVVTLAIGLVVGGLAVSGSAGPTPTPAVAEVAPTAPPTPDIRIVCHALADIRCRELAGAVIRTALDPDLTVKMIDLWPTLLCGNDFDCPAYRLRGRQALGSAVVTTTSDGELWVNITGSDSDAPTIGGPGRDLDAWVIRSGPI